MKKNALSTLLFLFTHLCWAECRLETPIALETTNLLEIKGDIVFPTLVLKNILITVNDQAFNHLNENFEIHFFNIGLEWRPSQLLGIQIQKIDTDGNMTKIFGFENNYKIENETPLMGSVQLNGTSQLYSTQHQSTRLEVTVENNELIQIQFEQDQKLICIKSAQR